METTDDKKDFNLDEYNKQYFQLNKQKIYEYKKKWRDQHREHLRELNKKKYKENKEYSQRYYKSNKEKIKTRTNQYKLKNKEKEKERNKKWKFLVITGQKGSLAQLKCKIHSTICNSLIKQGFTKKSRTYDLLKCSYEEFLNHLGHKPEGNYHLDHICPCSQAQNEEELIKLQHYTNFRWLKAEDNLLKSDNKTQEAEEMCRMLLNRNWIM